MNEEYVKIKDYPYYISNMGNVKNKTGRILKPKITNKGYLSVALNIAGMKLGISHQNICKCLKGERKTAKGYSFRRA